MPFPVTYLQVGCTGRWAPALDLQLCRDVRVARPQRAVIAVPLLPPSLTAGSHARAPRGLVWQQLHLVAGVGGGHGAHRRERVGARVGAENLSVVRALDGEQS